MESSEASGSNSRESPSSLQYRRKTLKSSSGPYTLSPATRAYNRQQAYAPPAKKVPRPYHPTTQPRIDKNTEAMRHIVREKVKTLENKLAEAQSELHNVTIENRTYKTLIRRQEAMLKQYEGTETSLPQVMQQHDEDMRVVKSSLKAEKRMVRELEYQVKSRDDQLIPLRSEYQKLLKLCQDDKLTEREKLTEEVERLKERLKEKEEKILVLTRRVMLESKNSRYELGTAEQKLREAHRQLNEKREECERLKLALGDKQKFIVENAHRFAGNRSYSYVGDPARSVTSLNGTSFPGLNAQIRNDPSILWQPKGNYDQESRSSSVATGLSVTPTHASNGTLPNVNRRAAANKNRKSVSHCEIVELPQISIRKLELRNNGPFGSTQDSNTEVFSSSCNNSPADSKEDLSQMISESHGDSLDDELDSEIQRIEAGSGGQRHSISITVRNDGVNGDGGVSKGDRKTRKVSLMASPDVKSSSSVSYAEKGNAQKRRDSVAALEENTVGKFDVESSDNSSDDSSSDGSEDLPETGRLVKGKSNQKKTELVESPKWDEMDYIQMAHEERMKPRKKNKSPAKSPESLLEMEEMFKKEKEKSLELKAEYEKFEEARIKNKQAFDRQRDDAIDNNATIDVEQRAKLLRALNDIDSVSNHQAEPAGKQEKKRATIFTTSTLSGPRRAHVSRLIDTPPSPVSEPPAAVSSSGQKLLHNLFGSRAAVEPNTEDKLYDNLKRLTVNDRNNNDLPTASNRL